jgi:hypothetical protein
MRQFLEGLMIASNSVPVDSVLLVEARLTIESGVHCSVLPLPVKRGLKFLSGPMFARRRAGMVS